MGHGSSGLVGWPDGFTASRARVPRLAGAGLRLRARRSVRPGGAYSSEFVLQAGEPFLEMECRCQPDQLLMLPLAESDRALVNAT